MPRSWVIALILICIALNGAGFLWHLFEPVPFYDEIAHFLTPFVLVAVVAEIIYRNGGDDEFFGTPRRAVITGAAIGFIGAAGWELVEVVLDLLGFPISHTIPDTIFDVVLGIAGGAIGAWAADRYLDRLFGRSRIDPNRPRVR
ncbi:hypothetical protein BH18ACT10_BH18ACT10_07050 [soil metagenome]